MSQRRSSPCGLFSRAEDKVKLSDDEIEEAFTKSATVCRTLFHALRSPLGVLPHESPIRVPETQSAFHPHAQRNVFRRRDVRLQSRSFARWNPRLTGIEQVHGFFSSQSFWKRGSFRSESNIGSSRSSAGVSGMPTEQKPPLGIESTF